jgi:hypothetical protein
LFIGSTTATDAIAACTFVEDWQFEAKIERKEMRKK